MNERLKGKFVIEETAPHLERVLDEVGEQALSTVQAILECYAKSQGRPDRVTHLLVEKVKEGAVLIAMVDNPAEYGTGKVPSFQYLDRDGGVRNFDFPRPLMEGASQLDFFREHWGPVELALLEIAMLFHASMRPAMSFSVHQMANELVGVQYRVAGVLRIADE